VPNIWVSTASILSLRFSAPIISLLALLFFR